MVVSLVARLAVRRPERDLVRLDAEVAGNLRRPPAGSWRKSDRARDGSRLRARSAPSLTSAKITWFSCSPSWHRWRASAERDCGDDEVRIPFHVGADRSRTWVLSRSAAGVRLKHEHRHEDGVEDEISRYGGDTRGAADGLSLDFHADAHRRAPPGGRRERVDRRGRSGADLRVCPAARRRGPAVPRRARSGADGRGAVALSPTQGAKLFRIHGYNSVNLRLGYPSLEIRAPREVLLDG
jgi:hypothetical protein